MRPRVDASGKEPDARDREQFRWNSLKRRIPLAIILNLLMLKPTEAHTGTAVMRVWSITKHAVMTFWYPYVRALNSIWPSITIQGKRLVVFPDVYKPLENEYACADYCREGDRMLDLGCGSGVGAVFCAPKVRELLAVDINSSAVKNTEENCRLNGLNNVAVKQSDMFSGVEGRFDLILANPPYIEAEFENEDKQFATSVRYLPTLFAQVGQHLAEDGRLLIQFPIWFRGRIEKLASEQGLRVVAVRRLPPKSPGLFLLSLLYMQVGFRSAFYLLQPMPGGAALPG
jgi:release factor glutamine methyltransferase